MQCRTPRGGNAAGFVGALIAAGLVLLVFVFANPGQNPPPARPSATHWQPPPVGTPETDPEATHDTTDTGQDNPDGANPPAAGPDGAFEQFAAEGQGHPTRLLADRAAVLHVAGRRFPLPCTLWFDDQTAPGGDTPLTFRIRRDGSGYYDFVLGAEPGGGPGTPCRFTEPQGESLVVYDVKFSIADAENRRVESTFKLQFVRP